LISHFPILLFSLAIFPPFSIVVAPFFYFFVDRRPQGKAPFSSKAALLASDFSPF